MLSRVDRGQGGGPMPPADWQAAGQALDDLMGKLVVLHRLLEAEERLPTRARRRNG